MAKVATDSRSRVAIDWYDDEAEAEGAAARLRKPDMAQAVAEANIGVVQCGRDPGFDKVVEGVQWYAVVTP